MAKGYRRTRLLEAPNFNHLWAGLLIEELVRNGVDIFCICPGSRSTPLTWAVAEHPSAKSVVHFDERGAAFHALGIAKASGQPAAFICTSGTAVANAFPAVVEASMTHVPLVVLTADRPPELQDTGANQTIDQVNLFGGFVQRHAGLWGPAVSRDTSLIPSTIERCFRGVSGPIHLNCMIDEPLAPVTEAASICPAEIPSEMSLPGAGNCKTGKTGRVPARKLARTVPVLPADDCAAAAEGIQKATKGLVLVGGLSTVEETDAAGRLARALGWPALPDITSGLRTRAGENTVHYAVQLLSMKTFHDSLSETDLVLHIGGQFTSRPMLQFLGEINASGTRRIDYLRVTNHSRRLDPPQRVTQRIICDIAAFCEDLARRVQTQRGDRVESLVQASKGVAGILDSYILDSGPLTEAGVARIVTRDAPGNGVLFLGNSMPIRDADKYGAAEGHGGHVAAMRGASGIDGNIATAAGYARGLEKKVTAVIGDLAALHDLNSLALLKNLPAPLILVIINNNGGGIFHFLPIAEHPKHFEHFFGTPHGLSFDEIARAFDLAYFRPATNQDLRENYTAALERSESCIIEIQTDRQENLRLHHELDEKIAEALADL
ncbi:MAG: 2-succinyl-5-enolpyruvyl-6-hydroxy-3-cyclohexene-1-carboxylic-acid synthase [Candidatus Hydrogenedentes bacterium]|nr:2-succinyl-5-enolpyruvyl-6-hydroxy-3-cyclohexene-1-carboxylic-acid synthase [Candidatus Hydrogenedentota bacterium]